MPDGYTIRAFRPEDLEGFLALYERVHGEAKSAAWFNWKYAENPYADRATLIVAEHEGRIVGARPLFALPMRTGTRDLDARQPADGMVHPEHRRRGVFSAMIDEAVTRCRRAEVNFLFTFPNALSGPAYRKKGWTVLGRVPERFRIHHPAPLIAAHTPLPGTGVDRGVSAVLRGVTAAERLGRPQTAGIQTQITTALPVDQLMDLYDRARPEGVHAARSPAFMRWRFRNPDWSHRTFLAHRGSRVQAGVVAGTRELGNGVQVTRCIDVLPLTNGEAREAALEQLLVDVVGAHEDSDLFVLPGGSVSGDVARRCGFLSDASIPLAAVAERTELVVKPLTDAAAGLVTDRSTWTPTFVEYDTA